MNHSSRTLVPALCNLIRASQDGRDPTKTKKGYFRGFLVQIYRGAKMHFHTQQFFVVVVCSFAFTAYIKENTLSFKRGTPPLKLWNTDTASFILAKVD